MITEVFNFVSNTPIYPAILIKYNRLENIRVDSYLHNTDINDYVEQIKNRLMSEPDSLILIIVQYIPPIQQLTNLDDASYLSYKDVNKNRWGFKVLNPKLF